ncbi:hypothetical protein SAMN05216188_10974 [Lentzea xinjiangensis]|uniref:SD-repeat containing protein B domain-containing protein n=1 Tax=Lentzea xinjiangensis TaxID=402600 RepID=A0A1H9MHZ9_9PSEU|nr:SdrD B-like domain-containing protein [Lentzea xinjiangensis]SER23340.1 hypothetical protein SAMN05216188_10974 [Lentzea xinjiangensis]
MLPRPLGLALRRFGVLTTAAMLAFGGVATTAAAQEADPPASVSASASPPPVETTTSAPPPVSADPPVPDPSAPATSEPPATTEPPVTSEPPATTEPPAPAQPRATSEAPAPAETPSAAGQAAETGNVSVTVFVDANRNGVVDLGEGLGDSLVSLWRRSTPDDHRKFTDASGRVLFTGIPVGRYGLHFQPPAGWTVYFPPGGNQVTVEANKTLTLTAAAERPFHERLTAAVAFDRQTYAYPATARITVTLTNTGAYPIANLQAGCDSGTTSGEHLGAGPGWDVLRGAGVTLAAGEQRTIVIDEALPEASRDRGEAVLSCVFAPNVADNYGVSVLQRVKVTGGKGTKTMLLVDGGGKPINGVKITLLDGASGAEVAVAESDAAGKVAFTDVQPGDYKAVASPPWAFNRGGSPQDVYVFNPGSTSTYTMVPAPASKAALRTTVAFDKPNYLSYETMRMTFTITNVGEETAQKVRLPLEMIGNPRTDPTDYGPIGPSAAGLTIAPGETKTVVAVSPISDWQQEPVTLTVSQFLDYTGRKDNKEDWFSASTVITFVEGDVRGVLYGDKNHNGVQDPGEALAGAEVTIARGRPRYSATRTTDAEGRFLFEDAPAGGWNLRAEIDGWTLPGHPATYDILVTPEGLDLSVRAERATSAVLQPTMTFDRASYQPDESASLAVTLTNAGDRPIVGVTADCTGYDQSYLDDGPAWGDLAPNARGVTMAAGETRTFTVVAEVPQQARQIGEFQALCHFGPGPRREDDAEARAWASVPGAFGSVRVPLFHDTEAGGRKGVTDVKFVLRSWFGDAKVAEAVPDANGVVTMPRVPAGPYKASVEGRWKIRYESQANIKVLGDQEMFREILLVPDDTKQPWPPAPEVPGRPHGPGSPPVPGNPAAPGSPAAPGGPAPQPSAGAVLAKTGASVLGLGVLGALLVAFGIGARLASRNREAQDRGRA